MYVYYTSMDVLTRIHVLIPYIGACVCLSVCLCVWNQQMFSLFVFQRIPSFALRKQEQWTITP